MMLCSCFTGSYVLMISNVGSTCSLKVQMEIECIHNKSDDADKINVLPSMFFISMSCDASLIYDVYALCYP
jgi:hypothetical protein